MLSELKGAGATILSSAEPADFFSDLCSKLGEHVYIFIGTGGSEGEFAKFFNATRLPQPIVLLSHSLNNSLPAAMETRAYLEKQGIKSRIVHGTMDRLKAQIQRWSQFAKIQTTLSESRLGVLGGRSDWLIASGIDKDAVQNRWGFELVEIPLNRLLSAIEDEMTPETVSLMNSFKSHAVSVDASDEELRSAAKVVQSMIGIVREENLDAVTVKCFKLFEETGITGCQSLSFLNDLDGKIAGCEGDIPATFTMMLLKQITGQSTFMANVADVDLDENTVILAHCTIPVSMIEKYDITSHFETGASVAVRGTLPKKEVTLAKIWGDDLTDSWIARGRIVENLSNDSACRTQIRVKLEEPVDYFLERSLANHHIVILGDHATKIREFLSFATGC